MSYYTYTEVDQVGRITEQTFNNGDGTGTRTTYDADGNVASVEQLTDLPIPQPPEPSDAEKIAELQATVDALLDALTGGAP